MTREGYLKHKELFTAWSNGAEIEIKDKDCDVWVVTQTPCWSVNRKYRLRVNKPTYLELHEKCELKVGDRVRILRGWKEDGFTIVQFCSDLEYTVGKVGEITIKDHNSYCVQFEDDYWYYPYFVLEKYVEEWIPFTFEDDLLGNFIIDKDRTEKSMILRQTKTGVATDDTFITYRDLLEDFMYLDTGSCGKLKK